MRLLQPIRFGVLLATLAAGVLGDLGVRKSAQATPVANEYSMEVSIVPTTDAVGGATFVVEASVVHGGVSVASGCFNGLVNGVDDDGDTLVDEADEVGLGEPFAVPPFGCYTVAQWSVDYDQALVDLLPLGTLGATGIVKVAAAPSQCNRKSDNGSRALAGCANVAPPPSAILAYTGQAFNLTFDCIAAGTAVFTLVLGVDETFVSDGVSDRPIHSHTDSIQCTGGATPTPTGIQAATPTPTPAEPAPLTVAASPQLDAALIGEIETGAYAEGQFLLLVRDSFNTGVLRELSGTVELLQDTPWRTRPLRLLFMRAADAEVDGLLTQLGARPDVLGAGRNHVGTLLLSPNDPYWPYQANLGASLLNMPAVWDRWQGRPGTRVAVMDTGINPIGELSGRIVGGRNFVLGGDAEDTSDPVGHGSKVACVIACTMNNATGTAGIAPKVGVVPVKVCTPNNNAPWGICYENQVAYGLQWIDDNNELLNIQVVNMSFQTVNHPAIDAAIGFLNGDGVILVGAAGNNGASPVAYPASIYNVIAVAGTTNTGARDSRSSYGVDLDFAAPYCTMTMDNFNSPVSECGTSVAAPVIAGLAALYKSHSFYWPGYSTTTLGTPAHFYNRLKYGLVWNNQVGYGVPRDFWETTIVDDCHSRDYNGNFVIDVGDAQTIAYRYGTFWGHPLYDVKYDLEPWPYHDYDTDIKDLQFMFGRIDFRCPP